MSNDSTMPEPGPETAPESAPGITEAAPETAVPDPEPEAPEVLEPDAGSNPEGQDQEAAEPSDTSVVEESSSERPEFADQSLRVLEALLFASTEPLSVADLKPHLGEGADLPALLEKLAELYRPRGVNLVRRADRWAFRTAGDLGYLLRRERTESRPLSRAALETLAIIAYHQPATRAEVEEVRGVATGKGTLDLLMETGWVRMRGRRRTPGRPVTYGTTEDFLDHFGLEALSDLPGLEELKGAGLLSNRLPPNMQIPLPFDGPLRDDEDPLDPDDIEGQDEPPE
jgi:segregation and condensation protein B